MDLVRISRELCQAVDGLTFAAPVTHVYNPLVYAREPHERYLRKYGTGRPEALLLGMNPGPFGMAQTGVPFGDVGMVRDFLGITGKVDKPAVEHPSRPILGFDCRRGEVSGQRLWGWARESYALPERFFEVFFVANYCPLAFMDRTGRNVTPDKLPADERTALLAPCDLALRRVVETLSPRLVVGVGRFARTRAEAALRGLPVELGEVLHPSPLNPRANRGWAGQATDALRALGLTIP